LTEYREKRPAKSFGIRSASVTFDAGSAIEAAVNKRR
jgi:hypothetical protein